MNLVLTYIGGWLGVTSLQKCSNPYVNFLCEFSPDVYR
nr:MAG TPA: hypothetical protein [Caudoviricetes sp.]